MALLSSVPELPPEDELAQLQDAFFTSFKSHIYMNVVEVGNSSNALPPYLQLALASISAATSPVAFEYLSRTTISSADLSADLFIAGFNVWSVMLETDNREARLHEAVVAVSIGPPSEF